MPKNCIKSIPWIPKNVDEHSVTPKRQNRKLIFCYQLNDQFYKKLINSIISLINI